MKQTSRLSKKEIQQNRTQKVRNFKQFETFFPVVFPGQDSHFAAFLSDGEVLVEAAGRAVRREEVPFVEFRFTMNPEARFPNRSCWQRCWVWDGKNFQKQLFERNPMIICFLSCFFDVLNIDMQMLRDVKARTTWELIGDIMVGNWCVWMLCI